MRLVDTFHNSEKKSNNEMFGWTYEEERVIHERIANALMLQALPIFVILYRIIPCKCRPVFCSSGWFVTLIRHSPFRFV
jgi:hypothetical protein